MMEAFEEQVVESRQIARLQLSRYNEWDEKCDCLARNQILSLRMNCCFSLGEQTGAELGRMLAADTALLKLDISFNSLRTKGVQMFLHGLRVSNLCKRTRPIFLE